jgi:hypothetical protein
MADGYQYTGNQAGQHQQIILYFEFHVFLPNKVNGQCKPASGK